MKGSTVTQAETVTWGRSNSPFPHRTIFLLKITSPKLFHHHPSHHSPIQIRISPPWVLYILCIHFFPFHFSSPLIWPSTTEFTEWLWNSYYLFANLPHTVVVMIGIDCHVQKSLEERWGTTCNSGNDDSYCYENMGRKPKHSKWQNSFSPTEDPPLSAHCRSYTTREAVSGCSGFQCHIWCRLSEKQNKETRHFKIATKKATESRQRVCCFSQPSEKALECQIHWTKGQKEPLNLAQDYIRPQYRFRKKYATLTA